MAPARFLRILLPATAPVAALLLALAAASPDATAAPGGCRGGSKRNTDCTSPGGNQPPTISGTPAGQVMVGDPYAFTPTASDPEGKTLTFSIANRPPWAGFDTATGRLSGTPGAASAGEYMDITIRASDGKKSATLAPFSIIVSSDNRAPSIWGTPNTAAREGQAWEFKPSVSDPDGDSLSFTIVNRPPWASFNASTGRLSGTPGTGTVGTYPDVTIRVSDGVAVATLPAFAIVVEQTSLGSATLSWSAPTSREDGSPLTNLAGYRVRYGTTPGSYPSMLQIPNPGITSCVIENLPAGTYYFVATAYDANGQESQFSATVTKTIG